MNAVTEGRKVLLEIADLKVHFEIKDGKQWFWQPPKTLKAVDGVTLRLYEGETLGAVHRDLPEEVCCCTVQFSGRLPAPDHHQLLRAGRDHPGRG